MQGTPVIPGTPSGPASPAGAKSAPQAAKEPAVLSYAVSRDIFLHPGARRPAWARYLLALGMVLVAWGFTLLLQPIVSRPVSGLFYLAVIFAAYYGGLGPAL